MDRALSGSPFGAAERDARAVDRVVGGRRGLASSSAGVDCGRLDGRRARLGSGTTTGRERWGAGIVGGSLEAGGGECRTTMGESSPGSMWHMAEVLRKYLFQIFCYTLTVLSGK